MGPITPFPVAIIELEVELEFGGIAPFPTVSNDVLHYKFDVVLLTKVIEC
jgi:hypothetical protein